MFNNVLSVRDDDEEYKKILVSEPTKNSDNVVYYKI